MREKSPNNVKMEVNLKYLDLNENEQRILKFLSKDYLDDHHKIITLNCDFFPFIEQNKNWLKHTLSELIKQSKVNLF